MTTSEIACTCASLIFHDDGISAIAEKIAKLVSSANVSVESYWPSLFAKLCEKRNIEDLSMNVGSGGGAAPVAAIITPAAPATTAIEEKKEEPKEDTDDDLGFNLFD